MNRMIEVIYEDEVLKPLKPIEGLRKSEKTWALLCPRPDKEALHELVGTLTHEEAKEMQKPIDGCCQSTSHHIALETSCKYC